MNDRQFLDFEDDVDAAARTGFSQHASCSLIEEGQRKKCLIVALNLFNVVRIAWSSLDVIKNVILTQTTITDDVNAFDDSLLWLWLSLLGENASRANEGCGDSSQEAHKEEPKHAI